MFISAHPCLSAQPLPGPLLVAFPSPVCFPSRFHHSFPFEKVFSPPSACLPHFASSPNISNQQIRGSHLGSVLLIKGKEEGWVVTIAERWSQPGESTVSSVAQFSSSCRTKSLLQDICCPLPISQSEHVVKHVHQLLPVQLAFSWTEDSQLLLLLSPEGPWECGVPGETTNQNRHSTSFGTTTLRFRATFLVARPTASYKEQAGCATVHDRTKMCACV